MKRIVLFASGSGSNAENIIKHFQNLSVASVVKVYCNTPNAFVFDRCKRLHVPCELFSKLELSSSNFIQQLTEEADWIVLAGFLLKIPETLIKAFPQRIINIHPALLPKYGGKGMYGMHVHRAVKENNEKETGISIHFVNEHYDEGAIIFQAATPLDSTDTPEAIATKVHALEYAHFPSVIQNLIEKDHA